MLSMKQYWNYWYDFWRYDYPLRWRIETKIERRERIREIREKRKEKKRRRDESESTKEDNDWIESIDSANERKTR